MFEYPTLTALTALILTRSISLCGAALIEVVVIHTLTHAPALVCVAPVFAQYIHRVDQERAMSGHHAVREVALRILAVVPVLIWTRLVVFQLVHTTVQPTVVLEAWIGELPPPHPRCARHVLDTAQPAVGPAVGAGVGVAVVGAPMGAVVGVLVGASVGE